MKKGQGRIAEAVLAVALIISFMLVLNFIAPMQLHTMRRTSYYELKELAQSLYQCLETTGTLEEVLTTNNSELLNKIATTLLPAGTYYNITIEEVSVMGTYPNQLIRSSVILTLSNLPESAKERCEAATIRALYTPTSSEASLQETPTTYIIYITLYRVTE